MESNFGGKQKKKKKKRRTAVKQRQHKNFTVNDTVEISLSDFANAPDRRDALKKMSKKMTSLTANRLSKVLETPAEYNSTSDGDIPWYDREDVESVDEALSMDEHSDNENGVQEESKPRRKCPGVLEPEAARDGEFPDHVAKCYPFDVWCLLAKYIKPEQIQTFASICRGANEAVNVVCFWIRLYQNCIVDPLALPDRLKPDWIESRAGLKMRVVRAMFIGYNNLRNLLLREKLETARNTQTLSKLVGLQCCQTWYKPSSAKQNNSYTFYFKFKCELDKMVSTSQCNKVSACALDDDSDYLTWNYERRFIVLQMTVSNFVCLQSVCGETLTDICANLSRNLRYHCVKMIFHSYRKDGKYRKNDGTMIVLDPVCEVRVLRWWDPSYPHCDE